MSMMRAPAATSSRARLIRASKVRSPGPSENESGVALRMPMSAGGSPGPPSVEDAPAGVQLTARGDHFRRVTGRSTTVWLPALSMAMTRSVALRL